MVEEFLSRRRIPNRISSKLGGGGGNGYIVVNRRVYWDVLVPG